MSANVADVEREVVERYPALAADFHVIPDGRECPDLPHTVLLLDPPGVRLSLRYDGHQGLLTHDGVFGPRAYMAFGGGRVWVPPTLPGSSAPLHPLLTWFVVLFGLSELARYQPTKWAAAIDINRSADATALEYLLDTAHLACANLIVDLFTADRPSPNHETEMWKRHERIRSWNLQQELGEVADDPASSEPAAIYHPMRSTMGWITGSATRSGPASAQPDDATE
jgi:hypothetical protein